MSQSIDPSAIDWNAKLHSRHDLRLTPSDNKSDSNLFSLLDPITRQCYRIGTLEKTVIELLNGRRTLRQIFEKLSTRFESVHPDQFLRLVGHLQSCGLVNGSSVFSSATRPAKSHFALNNLVSWQIRGLQPDPFLVWLAPHTDGLFSAFAVRAWLLFSILTLGFVVLDFPRLLSQTEVWNWIIRPVDGSSLFVVFLVTRALHELGHAFVCQRHGVRCPDIGLFVILGAPCVYCDVSESAHLPNRWQRAAVASGGIYVELIVASLAAWVWLLTLDGPVNTLALQTMIVCSISTVLINANPLMRFDGYYILSDFLDEPNLRSRADLLANRQLLRWVLGRNAVLQGGDANWMDTALITFSWAGWLYRAGLTLVIATALYAIYDNWQLSWVGRILAATILISWWGVPILRSAKEMISTSRTTKSQWRLGIFTAVVAIGAAALPIPYRETANGWTQPAQMQGVYALRGGRLVEQLSNNDTQVSVNQLIMRLSDLNVERDLRRLEAIEQRASAQLVAHRRNRIHQETQAIDLAPIESTVEIAKQQVVHAQNEVARLNLCAPASGKLVMMPVPANSGRDLHTGNVQYSNWADSTNLGRFIAPGTMVAAVCSSESIAVLPITDKQLEWIAEGTLVRLRFACDPREIHHCQVRSITTIREAKTGMRVSDDSSKSLAKDDGQNREKAYAAIVELPKRVQAPLYGTVDAVFIAPPQTITSLCKRWLRENLRWLAD